MNRMTDYQKHSLNEVAVMYIKNKILSGEFKSGDKLVEADISNELSISRAPVREAMRQLNVQGLIMFLPRKGNYVLEMSAEETLEVFDIRVALEEQILALIVKNQLLHEKEYTQLSYFIDSMQKQEGKYLSLHEKIYQLNYLDLSFHSHLWNISRSARRGQILENLFLQLLIAMNRNVLSLGTFSEKAVEHERILDALRRNDLEEVLNEFKIHIYSYVQATQKNVFLT